VHNVEIDDPKVGFFQMGRADQEVAVDIARAHVAEPGREELNPELAKNPLGSCSEQLANRGNVLEASEEL
jgi:hypothetical protein